MNAHGPHANLVMRMADILERAGVTAADCDDLSPDEWRTAEWCALGTLDRPCDVADDTTRSQVRYLLAKREAAPDPFAGLGS